MREKLASYRGKRQQKEMAALYDITQQAWSSWEKGNSAPGVTIMKRLEKDSGIPMEELFPDVFKD